jgi:hypothetical protein
MFLTALLAALNETQGQLVYRRSMFGYVRTCDLGMWRISFSGIRMWRSVFVCLGVGNVPMSEGTFVLTDALLSGSLSLSFSNIAIA